MIKKPLLAATYKEEELNYPVYATPKIDGIRSLKLGNNMLSRTFKLIPNIKIRRELESVLPENADGEIIIVFKDNLESSQRSSLDCSRAGHSPQSTFNDTSSIVMTIDEDKKKKKFRDYKIVYYQFDLVNFPEKGYLDRMQEMASGPEVDTENVQVIKLIPERINNKMELLSFETRALEQGFEGVMIRSPNGKYKQGRSSVKEGILIKIKRFQDNEAEIIGFNELMNNLNEKQVNEVGASKRSHKKENLSSSGTLGSFNVRGTFEGNENCIFDIGTGMTNEQRRDYWNDRNNLLGKIVKYKYFPIGNELSSSGKLDFASPRHPVFLGFRSIIDI
jgi:DNA ligase-1